MDEASAPPTIRVASHRVEGGEGSRAYAVYTVVTSQTGAVWRVDRRWGQLRELYYELWLEWRAQLQRYARAPPSFRHHTYRLGSRRLDDVFLRARERQMERVLAYFAAALGLSFGDPAVRAGPQALRLFLCDGMAPSSAPSTAPARRVMSRLSAPAALQTPRADGSRIVDPPYRGMVELTRNELQRACDAPTPDGFYYTPAAGWPSVVAAHSRRGRHVCCQTLMDEPASEEAAAGGGAEAVVGELCVEVLECAGLPNLDTFSRTDAYALVLFEGCAARTCAIESELEPMWHAEAPRAFRLPIRSASSTLFVAILDDDSALGALHDDDPVGRVLIQPTSLRPRSRVDAWWPLQHRAVGERPGERGAVRLRLCATWRVERELLLAPARLLRASLAADAPPDFTLHLASRRALAAADYAYVGREPERRYAWAVLRANLAEIARAALGLKHLVHVAREVLFWRRPRASLALLVGWQALTFYPQYIPATCPLLLLLLLDSTHAAASAAAPLLRPLPFWQLCASVALPSALGAKLIPPLDLGDAQRRGPKPTRHASALPYAVARAEAMARTTLGVARTVTVATAQVSLGVAEGSARLAVRSGETAIRSGAAAVQTGAVALQRVGSMTARGFAADGGADGGADAPAPATPPSPGARSTLWGGGWRWPAADEGAAAGGRESIGAEHLDDDAALETARAIWASAVAINSALWSALRRALRLSPATGRRRRRRRAPLELVRNLADNIDPNAINPMAWVLGPVQNALGDVLLRYRALERVLTWRDSAAAAALYLGAAALALILALIPWGVVIPWAVRWGARAFGLALFGPHMLYVGRRVDAIAAASAAAPGASPPSVGRSRSDEDDEHEYALVMESSRAAPRQPCVPDLRSSFNVRAAASS